MIVNLNETRYYYLTTGNHADREHHVEQLLKGKSLKKIKPFETECSRKDIAGTNKGTSGSIGHARMVQQGLLDQAREKPFQPFVILEDDVSFFHEFVESIDVPDDSDMVYLGNSQLSVHSTKNFSLGTFIELNIKIKQVWSFGLQSTPILFHVFYFTCLLYTSPSPRD